MRKNEKYIYLSDYVAVYSSTIAQYTNTDNNDIFLFYATHEKNHIYIIREAVQILRVNITIGGVEMNGLLPVQNGSSFFIDISDAIESLTGVVDMTIQVVTPGPSIRLTYKLVPMVGYNYDNLARILSVAQGYHCNGRNLANFRYDRQRTLSNIAPPTKIIVPFEDGVRKFPNINELYLPCYNASYGVTNVKIQQGATVIAEAISSNSSLLKFSINYLQGLFRATLRIAGIYANDIILEDFNPAKKYVAVKWVYPYTNSVKVGTDGAGIPNYSSLLSRVVTFFELAEYEDEQKIESLESTGSEMPYIVKSGQRCKLRMTNLNAYDYIYYAQILKSESIEILFDTNLTTINYQPVKLEKSKITLPTNGTELYNLEFNVIISEND